MHQGSADHGDEQSSLLMYPESPRVLHSIISLQLPIKAYCKCLNDIHLRVSFVPGGQIPPAACDLSWNRMLNPLAEKKEQITSFINLYISTERTPIQTPQGQQHPSH